MLERSKEAEIFQFHYGSIKTPNIDSSDVPNRYISIPLWFD